MACALDGIDHRNVVAGRNGQRDSLTAVIVQADKVRTGQIAQIEILGDGNAQTVGLPAQAVAVGGAIFFNKTEFAQCGQMSVHPRLGLSQATRELTGADRVRRLRQLFQHRKRHADRLHRRGGDRVVVLLTGCCQELGFGHTRLLTNDGHYLIILVTRYVCITERDNKPFV